MSTPPRLGAVILTGGTAARMGGVDKASIEIAGVTLLERALAATMTATEVVVVGEQVPTSRPTTWTLEDPPRGGPAAGILAALDRFLRRPELVCVLAVDMPNLTVGTVTRLACAAEEDPTSDGAVLVDRDGRAQTLAAVYRFSSLQRARPRDRAEEHGLPVRRLVAGLRLVELPVVGEEAHDVDTWADLRRLREERGRRG
jgi:molybdopterin-guanine dinucleotide biosynthesis protein A